MSKKVLSSNRGVQAVLAIFVLFGSALAAWADNVPSQPVCATETADTPFVEVDSWIYPALLRLYSMGYLHTVYIGERPWTRAAIADMLDEVSQTIDEARNFDNSTNDQAQQILDAVARELHYSITQNCLLKRDALEVDSVYSTARAISGPVLRDSFHLGSSIVNDYGRPYGEGANSYSGFTATATAGRFILHLRGEFQVTPSDTGYNQTLAKYLVEQVDDIRYLDPLTGKPYYMATVPANPIAARHTFNPLEAYVSTNIWNHEFSFGRRDMWWGPGVGGGFAYSNNAENLYALHIDRQKPLYVPGLSRLTGPFRYEFMIGEVQGHTYVPGELDPTKDFYWWPNPGKPWIHLQKVSLKPTRNFEVSFERTVIWGGQGHEGISLHSFLRSFLSLTAPLSPQKNSNRDPGSRFGAFTLSYRLPMARNWLTFYADGEAHDDVCACDAPRRAAWRTGFYLSHLPSAPKVDLRTEVVWTDPPIVNSHGGWIMYWEIISRQGYTNKGQLFGDWIGREDKGGQAWLTYHLSGNENVQLAYRHQKASRDFIEGGTTINDFSLQVVKRFGPNFELNGTYTHEQWRAPIYRTGLQTVNAATVRLTWFPHK